MSGPGGAEGRVGRIFGGWVGGERRAVVGRACSEDPPGRSDCCRQQLLDSIVRHLGGPAAATPPA